MSAILGLRGTGSFDVSKERPESIRETTMYIEPNGSVPLCALLSMIKAEKANDVRFHWYCKGLPLQRLRINNAAGYAAGDTVLTVDTESSANGNAGAKSVRNGSVLKVERTGELLWVVDDPVNDTQIQVERAKGDAALAGGTAAALVDDDWIHIISTAHEEGSDLPAAIATKPTHYENKIQTFRAPLYQTRTAMKTRFLTGDTLKEAKKEAFQQFNIQKEMEYFFGEPTEGIGDKGQPKCTTGGIEYFLNKYMSANVVDVAVNFDEAEWDDIMETAFRYGSKQKAFICGSGAAKALNTMSKNGGIRMEKTPSDRSYGMDLQELIAPGGTLYIKSHPLFSAHPVLRYCGFVLDMKNLRERFIDDVDYKQNRQNNGEDARADEYIGDFGLELWHPETFMYIKRLQTFTP